MTPNEERFKKAVELLKTIKTQFKDENNRRPFTAFVDHITYWAFYYYVNEHWEDSLGEKRRNENGVEIVLYGEWKIFSLYSTVKNDEKIKILAFPCPGKYRDAE